MEPQDPAAPNTAVWPPPPTNSQPPTFAPPDYVSARRLSQLFIALTWATVVGDALSTLTNGRVLASHSSGNQIIQNVNLVVWAATSLCFLVWTHRASKNLRALGAQGLHHTPAWAVGCFFVPFLNLYRPYLVFRELWQASDPAPAVRASQSWPLTKLPPLLPAWWLCNLVVWVVIPLAYIIPIMLYVFRHLQTFSQPGATLPAGLLGGPAGLLVSLVTGTLSAVLGALVLGALTDRQETAARSLA